MQHFEREFSTGSIETPDEFDKYLDSIGYYRKHTARDATCLFRVISEQMYNAQIYHQDIRDICVRYMGMHENTYKELITTTGLTYEEYIAKLSKPKTHGTFAELHALAYRFKRNVLLFDPLLPGSCHVFKLPDVVYATERILHDPSEGTHVSRIEEYDDCQISLTLADGRYFILDHADETECILQNYLFCRFHNKKFETFTKQLRQVFDANQHDPEACIDLEGTIFLSRKNVSCVRQLLDKKIKPFSYKIAKALDTHIYRNIDFDVWNEDRKSNRFVNWPQGDSLKVGVGEYHTMPLTAIRKLSDVSCMAPHHDKNRSEKRKKPRWQSNDKLKNNKVSKWKEDSLHGIDYFTRTLHLPQQYCQYIAQPQHSSNRFTKADENGHNQATNKTVQSKKGNAGNGERMIKSDNNKNAPVKRGDAKSGKLEPLNTESEHHTHYVSQTGHNYSFLHSMIKRKNLLRSSYPPNLNARPSYQFDGAGLQRIDIATVRFFYNLGHEYLRFMQYHFPHKAVTSMFQNITGDRMRRYPVYYDSYRDMNDVATDSNRCVSFTREQQQQNYQNKPNEPQNMYRRSLNANTVNGPKNKYRSYRSEFSQSNRQFGDAEGHSKYQQQIHHRTSDYADAVPISETNSRTNEALQMPNLMNIPPPVMYYQSGATSDPRNVYGFDYGMYPPGFSPYVVPMQGTMMYSEPLTEEDMGQTYAYYPTYYYSAPMTTYQVGGHQQGHFYSQPLMPIPSNMTLPIQSSGTAMPVSIAQPMSTLHPHYVMGETNENFNSANNTTTATFSQNQNES